MRNSASIRVGVIGAGAMGSCHLRTAAMIAEWQLIGVYDADAARAETTARRYGITAYRSPDALCDAVDAVIIATPTCTHVEMALACLRAGCHVLVEKPIAGSVAEAERLVAASAAIDRVLMVGHVERYNPAVTALLALVDPQELFACDLRRLNTVPGRDRTANVVHDLMIHDLDLVLALAQTPLTVASALGTCVRAECVDHVQVLLRGGNGVSVALSASAVSRERVRMGRFFTREAQYTLDFVARALWVHNGVVSSLQGGDGTRYEACRVEQVHLPAQEPLALEQEHFRESIVHGTPPRTSAASALEAVRLADAILAAMRVDGDIVATPSPA